jgi:PAS domain S-box-containing protein
MTNKKTPSFKSTRRISGNKRPQTSKKTQPKPPPLSGTLWDDDRAFRVLVRNRSDSFSLLDSKGKILYRSPSAKRISGRLDRDVIQTRMLDWIWPEDASEVKKALALLRRSPGKDVPFHARIKNEAGMPRWIEGVGTNYLEDPAIGAILINYRDVTERKEQETILRESEETFRSIFDNSSAGVAIVGLNRRYRMVNPAYCEIFGYTREEFLKSDFLDLTHPEDVERSRKLMQDVLDGKGRNIRFAKRYLHKDGHTIWAEVSSVLVSDPDGNPSHFVTHILDVSERRRAEGALRESEEKASTMTASAPFGITFVDADGALTYANPAAEAILGLQPSRITGRKYDDTRWKITALDGTPFPPETLPFARVKAAGRAVYDIEHAIERENGERIVLSVNGAPLFAEDGVFSGMVATILDVTERKRAEEALQESEERYRRLFNDSLEGIGLSQGNRVIDANNALLEIFGYTDMDEFRAVPLLDHVAPESKELISRHMREMVEGRISDSRFAYKIIRKDGNLRELEISTSHIQIGNQWFSLGTFRDITDRARAETELHALAARHEALLAAIPEIVMEVNTEKVYVWANPAGIAFFGEDVIGKEAGDYFEGEQNVYADVQPLFNGNEKTIYLESWQRRKDGQKRLLAWWCRNLKNSRGEVTGALSSARDITEQRLADEQIQILSRFPTENPNPVMRITPEGLLLFANSASRPFLDMWKAEVGRPVPEDCRALVGEVYVSNALREIEVPCGERIYSCSLSPIQSAGYVNLYGRDITERKQAVEALGRQAEELRQRNADLARLNALTERRMRRLIAMRAIDTAITSSFKLELVLSILLGQLTDLLEVHTADILIFLPDLQTFRFACGRGFRNPIPEQTYVRKAASYANQAAQERRMIKVARLEERADAARIYPKTAGEDFSAYLCIPLMAKGLVKGVLEIFHRTAIDLAPEEESFLEMVSGQAAIAIDNAEMFEGLQASNDELTLAYTDTLTGWARTLELRNRETAGEAQRLAEITVRLARSLGAGESELVFMYRGAILHDIGMMGIPDSILLKPGPLTEEEWVVVRKHPQYAYELLSSINYLRSAIDIPYCHHERWDGSGYPRGLKGDQIPLAARIYAVVDVWDALRSRRAYRAAWTDADTRDYIRRQAGTLFDPKAAQVFLELISSL